jgi:hypothetical protein
VRILLEVRPFAFGGRGVGSKAGRFVNRVPSRTRPLSPLAMYKCVSHDGPWAVFCPGDATHGASLRRRGEADLKAYCGRAGSCTATEVVSASCVGVSGGEPVSR